MGSLVDPNFNGWQGFNRIFISQIIMNHIWINESQQILIEDLLIDINEFTYVFTT